MGATYVLEELKPLEGYYADQSDTQVGSSQVDLASARLHLGRQHEAIHHELRKAGQPRILPPHHLQPRRGHRSSSRSTRARRASSSSPTTQRSTSTCSESTRTIIRRGSQKWLRIC
eukprot:14703357-Heterocapsa_arctica.AAC.1